MGSKSADSQTTGCSHAGLHAIEDYGRGRNRVSFKSNHCWWNLATSFLSWEQTANLCVEVSPSSPTPKKAKVVSSAGKVMVISFFDIDGMVYQLVVPAHTTVTGVYYRDVLKVLQGHIRWKRSRLNATSWMLHNDNARSHVANVVPEYLAQINVKCIPHPPYSPDLAPCEFFLFPNLKKHLRERCFLSSEAVVKAAEAVLKDLSKNGFQHVSADWQKHWDKCTASYGDYYEKDHQYYEDE